MPIGDARTLRAVQRALCPVTRMTNSHTARRQVTPHRSRRASRLEAALLLYVVSMTAACSHRDDTAGAVSATASPSPAVATVSTAAQAGSTPRAGSKAGIPLDLSYVDLKSPQYARFKSWVDRAVGGSPGYAFSAGDAALMFRLTKTKKYCDLAVGLVDEHVAEAEAAIASSGRPPVARNSYLHVGPLISQLALTLDTCESITPAQRQRWSAYAEQAVWNVWHPAQAQWGDKSQPWTGWSTDNPGNNYYYSFLEATMYWALASGSDVWMADLRERRLPPLAAYYAKFPGGGSSEGTGYGSTHRRLFSLYRLWRDATGEDLANANTHLTDSIAYWAHATVPTGDHYAPIGDQSRRAVPELFDYHRRVVLEARQLTDDAAARETASWWLGNTSVRQMKEGLNFRDDLLPAGKGGSPPDTLIHHAEGAGHLFARSSWDRDAMWVAFVAGPYNESHAHQDQGAFTLFARDWLAVTANTWSKSGINQGTQVHNIVRFERSDPDTRQCQAPRGDRVVHQCAPTRSTMTWTPQGADGGFTATADLTPAYRGNPAVRTWQRRIDFGARRLTVRDSFKLGAGTRAVFQVNVPVEPQINGREATAGRLRMKVLEPAGATLSVHDWSKAGGREFRGGWRIDVAGGETGYVVELEEK